MQFSGMFVWIIVFYFYNIFPPISFIPNGYKRFSKTNSTDPRQRVPLRESVSFRTTDSKTGLSVKKKFVYKFLAFD